MRLAIEIERAGFREGLFPGFAGVESQVSVAVLIVALEHSVVRGQFVVDEFDGVTGLNGHGGGLEGKHAGICAELHFNGGGLCGTDIEADQHQDCAAGCCKGADDGAHKEALSIEGDYAQIGVFRDWVGLNR